MTRTWGSPWEHDAPSTSKPPCWVGVLEPDDDEGVRAARHIFGAEPTGPELLDCTRHHFLTLYERAPAGPRR
ncbi:DUF2992 family protein [Nocardiopsis rhodophaea]|uniref:DUF2992 family protein n=1 Tax=Nocardiopsis rhodophaea TaxID=280238 RepID=UPI00399C812B